MNSIHDMGGMHGFGLIVVEKNEPVFHADWEEQSLCNGESLVSVGEIQVMG